ncbi:MAG TPA: mechanosensitive ion channel family protein [Kiritimatiellae bacterium]|nr:mechanosensitive ion channel family protein [Kiritimatiellia bacterium]
MVSLWVEQTLGVPPAVLAKLLWSLVAGVAFLILRWIIGNVTERRISETARRYIVLKTVNYLLGFLLLIVMVRIWLGGVSGLAAYFGIVSAGLAIALQDPLTNIAGWIFITMRKPFVLGDRVQIGTHSGDVVDIGLFQFSIVEVGNWVGGEQSTGRLIHLPNASVFREAIANYTQGFNFIWNEVAVTVTFESNWRRAKELLTEIGQRYTAIKSEHAAEQVRRATSKFLIYFQHLTPIVWTSVIDYGVQLTIRYLCHPRQRRSSESAIWEAVLEEFSKCPDVDFAYPTQRFFDNVREGKRGLRPDRS